MSLYIICEYMTHMYITNIKKTPFASISLIAVNLFSPMDLSIKLYTIKSGGSIVYIEESQVFPKNVVLYSLKMILS